MHDRPEALLERVMAHVRDGRFTGLLRVRAKEGEAEVWFLSGIREETRFGVSTGDEAIERLRRATDPTFEALPRLPGLNGGFKRSLPPEGALGDVRPVALLRYCETYALTCTLELTCKGKGARVRYVIGELVGIDTDAAGDDALTEMLDSAEGTYRFALPPFELPPGTPVVPAAPATSLLTELAKIGTGDSARPVAAASEPPVPAISDAAQRAAEDQAKRRALEAAQAEARRKAEAEAEARRKAEAEAEARRKAEAEAEARRKAEAEEARRRAEAEARRKAEADAEARRKALAEEDARRAAEAAAEAKRKAEAEARRQAEIEAEARRQAEAAAEARRQAEEEARRQAEAEAEARRQAEAEAEAKKQAAAEAERQAELARAAEKNARETEQRLQAPVEEDAVSDSKLARDSQRSKLKKKGKKKRRAAEQQLASEPPIPRSSAKSTWFILLLVIVAVAIVAWLNRQ